MKRSFFFACSTAGGGGTIAYSIVRRSHTHTRAPLLLPLPDGCLCTLSYPYLMSICSADFF